MVDRHDDSATAFVIMPFEAEFDPIYNSFIKTTMESAGFFVTRADENTNSRNAVNEIIDSIVKCCVVVADLTDSNPNVYYELALAHSLHKPVIVLTQDIEALPFNIRAYHVIHYSTHFAEVDKARSALFRTAEGIRSGSTIFGNPYSDYTRTDIKAICQDGGHSHALNLKDDDTLVDSDEPGILDHRVAVEEGFERLNQSTQSIGARTEELGSRITAITADLAKTQEGDVHRPDQARRQRTFVMLMAQELNTYARFLSEKNDAYGNAIESARPALEVLLRDAIPTTDGDMEARDALLITLENTEIATKGFRDSTKSAAKTLSDLPSLEKSFNRARNLVVEQIRRLTANIDQTLFMLSRAREILRPTERVSTGETD